MAIVIDTVLCVFLVSPLGGVGAALARATLILTLFVYPAWRLKKVFGLYFDSDALKKSWMGSVVMAVVVVLMQLVWMDGFLLPLYVLVGGAIYILMLRSLNAVDGRDVQLFHQFAPKRFGAIVDTFAKLLGVEKLRGNS